ncbi:DUF397 domain-containing protein [Streptomyces sp. NBC_00356]|uniref:DUF397 domain-containing protein n=1 Tax=Streptomyces sp. NBC_00356 TaxID=2975724 RepID=UPI002E2544F5
MKEIALEGQPAEVTWFKSSYSAANNECIEVANLVTRVAVRDSKDHARGTLKVSAQCFAIFVSGVTT